MELKEIIDKVNPIIKETGAFIRNESGKVKLEEIEQKSLNNLVSYVDKTAEKMLVDGLKKIIINPTFITEEETIEQSSGEWTWIIDPLDGTTNFLHGIPLFSVSVALMQNGEIKCGWVYDIMHEDLFYAWENGGAYLNGKPISVSQQNDFGQALLVTGFPYGTPDTMRKYIDVFYEFMVNTRGVRRLGSAAIDLVYVACGRIDAFYEYGLNAWDVAGGTIIVKEAGGFVSDFNGGNDFVFGKELVATNGKIEKPILKIIQEKFL